MKASSDLLNKLNAGAERNKVVDKREEDMVTPDIEQIALNEELIGLPPDHKNKGIMAREARNKRLSHGKTQSKAMIQIEQDDSVEEQLLNISKLHN